MSSHCSRHASLLTPESMSSAKRSSISRNSIRNLCCFLCPSLLHVMSVSPLFTTRPLLVTCWTNLSRVRSSLFVCFFTCLSTTSSISLSRMFFFFFFFFKQLFFLDLFSKLYLVLCIFSIYWLFFFFFFFFKFFL